MESGGLRLRVLICDDTESIRRLLRILLELEGHTVRETEDALGLLEHLRDQVEDLPDLILLDAHMAPRDGWWAMGEIRADRRFESVPVILVTAAIHGLDPGLIDEAGFDAWLGKPFDPDDLLDLVSRTAAGRRAPSPPS